MAQELVKTKPKRVTKTLSMEVEDYLGRKHVRGVYVSQEIFMADMLNRTLIALVEERARKVNAFMRKMLDDAQQVHGVEIAPGCRAPAPMFDKPTLAAYAECVDAVNPFAGLSLLRQARTEQLQLATICHYMPSIADAARRIVEEYVAPDFTFAMHMNGVPLEDTSRVVFQMTEEQLREETPDIYWYFDEFLNMPYALETGCLHTARLMLAKCHSMKALEKLSIDAGLYRLRDTAMLETVGKYNEKVRYHYLMRQTQIVFILLTGYINGQFGMDRREAQMIVHNDIFD